MKTITIKPGDKVPSCVRYDGGTFVGVRLPRSVPFFDCRDFEDCNIRADYGADYNPILYGSERAAFALGLRVPARSYYDQFDTLSRGIQFYFDSRHENMASETARIVKSLRKALAELWRAYRKAKRNPAKPDSGGSVYYRPVAIELCNYGASVMADNRDFVVEGFDND
jgi:hypothetical protein